MNEDFYALWHDLPDPRGNGTCKIEICDGHPGRGLWGHNYYKHLKNPLQPWEDLFGEDLSRAARSLAACNGQRPDKFHVLGKLAGILQGQVRKCLERPLALLFDLYRARRENRDRKWMTERWFLVLPIGALFRVVNKGQKRQYGESCYFLNTTFRSPDERCPALVEELVVHFAKRIGKELRTRNKNEVLPTGHGRPGIRHREEGQNFHFVTPTSWGFIDGVWHKTAVPAWEESRVEPVLAPPKVRLLPPLPPREQEVEE